MGDTTAIARLQRLLAALPELDAVEARDRRVPRKARVACSTVERHGRNELVKGRWR